MSVLTRNEIRESLETDPRDGLVITPLLDHDQIGAASVDVRLGNEFILFRRRAFTSLDIRDQSGLKGRIASYQERIRIQNRQQLILHPNQLVLGSTLEYVKLPDNVAAYVIGRSSWGRLGLVIATATAVAPEFRGCITLELTNLGEVPLALYPGIRVAQLVLHRTEGDTTYDGRYSCPTGPQFSRISDDREIEFWCNATDPAAPAAPRAQAEEMNDRA